MPGVKKNLLPPAMTAWVCAVCICAACLCGVAPAHGADDAAKGADPAAAAKATQPQPKTWPFAEAAIEVRVKAGPDLNWYHGMAHTLALTVYQLSDPNAFNKLRDKEEDLAKLMDANRFDPTVTAFKQVVINPGDDRVIKLDRAENTKFVGLAAGYFALHAKYSTALYDVPVIVDSTGWVFKDYFAYPGRMVLNIYLGPQELQRFGSNQ